MSAVESVSPLLTPGVFVTYTLSGPTQPVMLFLVTLRNKDDKKHEQRKIPHKHIGRHIPLNIMWRLCRKNVMIRNSCQGEVNQREVVKIGGK